MGTVADPNPEVAAVAEAKYRTECAHSATSMSCEDRFKHASDFCNGCLFRLVLQAAGFLKLE